MRRRLTWLLVTLGIAALVRRLRRSELEPETHPADDPADELRRKLADSRAEETDVAPPEPSADTVEERRADVHQEGRAALDQMRDSEGRDA